MISPQSLMERLDHAHLPSLVASTYLLTGNERWLSDRFVAKYAFSATIQENFAGGYPSEAATEIKAGMAEAFAQRPTPAQRSPQPGKSVLTRLMSIVAGASVPADYGDFLMEELQLDGRDAKRPSWKLPRARSADAHVVVVGAGMSGLLMGLRLKQAGIPFTILEKNSEVGGTWLENRYPGCRVDNANHMYSYSFEPSHDFPQYFSTQPVLLDYFRRFAQRHGLVESIRFNTSVERAVYEEQGGRWSVTVRHGAGDEERIDAAAVISAVGQLNRPYIPDFSGLNTFKGPYFHSAAWNDGATLRGARIGVIGTGASAYQFAPAIAPEAEQLTIFQRTPPWAIPRPHYHDDVPQAKQWLLENLPYYARWYRFWLFWTSTDSLYPLVKVDPSWGGRDNAISAVNGKVRDLLAAEMIAQVADREELRAKVMPDYPFGGKRALLDNGIWLSTLKRANVNLVTAGIDRVVGDGIITKDGVHHRLDVLIFGTGFQARQFLSPMEVIGRKGLSLESYWAGEPRAFLGMMVPSFPNFFMLYGPNTNVVVNGSIIFFSECAARYIVESLRLVFEDGARAVEVREDVYRDYNARVDAANAQMAWGIAGVSNWYKNKNGRVTQNWPFPVFDYWQATRRPDSADLRIDRPTPNPAATGAA